MSKVVIVGLGYVGLPLAVRAALVGHDVVGVDVDPAKVSSLNGGHSYVEDVSDDRLIEAIDSGHFTAVRGDEFCATFDIAVIAVPTPLRDGNLPDLSYIRSAGELLAPWVRAGSAVVLESTTYPGTTEGLLAETILAGSGLRPGADYHLGYSPERIDPGSVENTLENTPKLVAGTDPEALAVIRAFYDTVVDRTVPVSSPKVAELAKIYENAFAQVCIALANEMAVISHGLGIDVWEMIDAANTKGHSIMPWKPGPGVGGHCVPIDSMYLAWLSRVELGRAFTMGETAQEINDAMPRYVVDRAVEVLNDRYLSLRGTEVLVLGLAYKPGVGDLRESPSVEIVTMLQAKGARVTVSDPHVQQWTGAPLIDAETAVARASDYGLVIIATDHDEFDYQKLAETAPLVLDCKHRLPVSGTVFGL
jgi:UDP-N-acetyl-D-glucosamine dehydrogenase